MKDYMRDFSVIIKLDGVTIKFKNVDDFASWLSEVME